MERESMAKYGDGFTVPVAFCSQFSIESVTNHYKCRGLKKQNLFSYRYISLAHVHLAKIRVPGGLCTLGCNTFGLDE